MEHRGRFQAQGKDLEASEPWAQARPLSHAKGVQLLDSLKSKIPKKEQKVRARAFVKCRAFIDEAARNNGIRVVDMGQPLIKSFPKNHIERVDVEVRKGIAFVKQ